MKKILIFVLAIILVVIMIATISKMNSAHDAELCALIEQKDSWTDDELECLYHWRNPGKYDEYYPSDKFINLYDTKVKHTW